MPFTRRQQEKQVFEKILYKCVTVLSGVPLNTTNVFVCDCKVCVLLIFSSLAFCMTLNVARPLSMLKCSHTIAYGISICQRIIVL